MIRIATCRHIARVIVDRASTETPSNAPASSGHHVDCAQRLTNLPRTKNEQCVFEALSRFSRRKEHSSDPPLHAQKLADWKSALPAPALPLERVS